MVISTGIVHRRLKFLMRHQSKKFQTGEILNSNFYLLVEKMGNLSDDVTKMSIKDAWQAWQSGEGPFATFGRITPAYHRGMIDAIQKAGEDWPAVVGKSIPDFVEWYQQTAWRKAA